MHCIRRSRLALGFSCFFLASSIEGASAGVEDAVCGDPKAFRNSVGFIIRADLEGNRIRSNHPKIRYDDAINRLGEALKKDGYRLSAAASRLQVMHEKKPVFFPDFPGTLLDAQKRFVRAGKESLESGGLDYVVMGEVRLGKATKDRMSGRYRAAATVNLQLLNVDTEEVAGVVGDTVNGTGRDEIGAIRNAMARGLEASMPVLGRHVVRLPLQCQGRKTFLVWFRGYYSERHETRPMLKQMKTRDILVTRTRSKSAEGNTRDMVATVRFAGDASELFERIEAAIEGADLDERVRDVRTSGSKVEIWFFKAGK